MLIALTGCMVALTDYFHLLKEAFHAELFLFSAGELGNERDVEKGRGNGPAPFDIVSVFCESDVAL